ncbi:MAG: hypothetical protein V1809_08825 [Planctomycetota bacterium]
MTERKIKLRWKYDEIVFDDEVETSEDAIVGFLVGLSENYGDYLDMEFPDGLNLCPKCARQEVLEGEPCCEECGKRAKCSEGENRDG